MEGTELETAEVIQGQLVFGRDVEELRGWIRSNPRWSRKRIDLELCRWGADGMPRADWVVRRTDADWRTRSGPSLEWLEWMESFVEQERFLGTCYRVANWRFVGSTQGRRRQDREHRLKVPVKDVYLHSQSCASLCARRFYF